MSTQILLPLPTTRPVGWHKLPDKWAHWPTRWSIQHCGHATATHPWSATDPEGRMVVAGHRAWSRVSDAKADINLIIEGMATIVPEGRQGVWMVSRG